MTHQENRLLRLGDQLRCLRDLACACALVHQAVPVRRQRLGDVELGEDDVRRVFDVAGSRRAGHRPPDRLVNDLVGLIRVLDRAAVFHRRREKTLLLDELDSSAADPTLGDTGALPAEEDHRRVLDQRAHHRAGDVGDPWPQRADAQARLARHAGGRLGHESGAQLMVRGDHRPPARVGFGEHVHEVGVRDAEQRVDALGLEEVENALVDGCTHGGTPFSGSVLPALDGELQVNRTTID